MILVLHHYTSCLTGSVGKSYLKPGNTYKEKINYTGHLIDFKEAHSISEC